MTDASPKRRAWFQLHLSTCVVLMCVAGVLVWANVGEPRIISEKVIGRSTDSARLIDVYAHGPGWPLPMWSGQAIHNSREEAISLLEGSAYPDQAAMLGVNICVAFVILMGAALACESYIRRRARKRTAQDPAP